jgi:hypothetical protein
MKKGPQELAGGCCLSFHAYIPDAPGLTLFI